MTRLKKFDYRIIFVVCAIFVLSLTAAVPAFALFGGKEDSFKADMVEITPNGKVTNTSKLYITPDAMRMDGMPGQGAKGMPDLDLSILVLKKKDKQYFYNHTKKLVFESPVDESVTQAGYKAMDNIESEKVLGKEKVSGYKCVKKEVIVSMSTMGGGMKMKLIVWESDKFEMPLRTMDEDGSIQEMRNIKTGKPSKKVFRPLKGYKNVDNMMAVMGMDFGAMMAQEDAMEEETQTRPKSSKAWGKKKQGNAPQANQQNLENMDFSKIMEQMGTNMSPEEKAQFMQAMNQAQNRIKDTKEGPGSAGRIWQFIPRRPGDKVADEFKTTNVLNVTMGTKAAIKSVFTFYKNKLVARGWEDNGMYLEKGEGSMSLSKGDQRLTISSAQDPGGQGSFPRFYMMQLNGPDI